MASPPSSRIMLGPSPSAQRRACSVHHQYSSSVSPFQANTGDTGGGDGRRAAWSWVEKMLHDAQRTSAPRCDERLDEHGGLDGHVQRPADPGAGERLAVAVLLAEGHQAGHLDLGQVDLPAAEIGQGQIGDLE